MKNIKVVKFKNTGVWRKRNFVSSAILNFGFY